MHKNHLIGCGVGIAIALAVVALSGGSAGSLGVLFAAVLCPVIMIGVMWFLMGPMNGRNEQARRDAETPVEHPTAKP